MSQYETITSSLSESSLRGVTPPLLTLSAGRTVTPKQSSVRERSKRTSNKLRNSSKSSTRSSSTSTPSSSGDDRRKKRKKKKKKKKKLAKNKKLAKLEKRLHHVESRSSLSHHGDEKMIPLFDPQTEQSIDSWVRRVDELAKCYKWDDLTVIKLVANRLVGMSRRWYDSQDHLPINWKNMKKLLIKQFTKPLPFSKLLREAALYETSSGQDFSEYCFNKLDKLKALKLQIPDAYLVDAVIGGITDENIARSARSSRFGDTNELYAYLSSLGSVPKGSRYDSGSKTVTRTAQQRFVKLSNGKRKVKVQCYNCKGPHVARDCTKPRLECFLCKRLGHKQNKCPRQNRKDNNLKGIGSVNETAKLGDVNYNPYVMNAMLNGKKCKCLVDTGSSCTIIRRSVAAKLGLELESSGESVLRSFAGDRVRSAGTVKVHVRIGQSDAVLNVVVLNDDRMIHACIIGRDFINLPNVLLSKIGTEVFVRQLGGVKTMCDLECFEIQKDDKFALNFGDIPKEQEVKCEDLLREFGDRISNSMADLGKTNAVKMEIKLITDEPVAYNPYRMPFVEKEILRGIIEELLSNNIIRESTSSYASPILLVKKKTDDYRMCVDYRRLNAITVKEKFPLPLIEEQLDLLGRDEEGNKYKFYTTLDLASSFYQVPMEENSIDKTAFITPDSHYEFLRMPFGLCNSPSVFQRLMNNALGSLRNKVAFPYMDDVIIPSTTICEGLKRLRLVLEAFRKHNLTLKISKCSFFLTKIDYLGREISGEGVRPGQRKIDAILQISEPQTVKQVRQFLGLSGYFRKFIKNYANTVEPLTRLTRKDNNWCWEMEQQQAFENVKLVLITRPVLAIFDPSLPTELHTDASSTALAAILFQLHDGKQRVVAYFSKQTTVDQRHYHSYELETMAVVYALKHFRVYLVGLQFTVITDCNGLRTTFSKKDLVPRVGRWWLQVQEFTFDIKFRSGARISHVDALSRLPVVGEVNQVDITEGEWILAAQLQDDQLVNIHKILAVGTENAETKQYFKEYLLHNGKIYRKLPNRKKLWVVPKAARWQVVRLCHDKAGHLSVEHSMQRIQLNYWFPKMRRFVTKYVNACLNCAYYKSVADKKKGKLYPIEKHPIPFHTIHLDHVGPFETSKSGKKFLLVIVVSFTKFTIIEAVKSTKVGPVIRAFQSVMCIFGVPIRIVSDRGTAFTSRTFRIFCESYAIKHILNAVATPRSNGQCERYNKTIVTMLATSSIEGDSDEWDTHVKELQSALNTAFNKSINTTPVQALIGYQARPMAEAYLLNSIKTSTAVDRINIDELRSRVVSFRNVPFILNGSVYSPKDPDHVF